VCRLGSHLPSPVSVCRRWLQSEATTGVTLYDCMHLWHGYKAGYTGHRPSLNYARGRGLPPHDVHGLVMMLSGRGLVVDVSDFLDEETCSKWNDLKRPTTGCIAPPLSPFRLRVPYFVLNVVRTSYRLFFSLASRLKQVFRPRKLS